MLHHRLASGLSHSPVPGTATTPATEPLRWLPRKDLCTPKCHPRRATVPPTVLNAKSHRSGTSGTLTCRKFGIRPRRYAKGVRRRYSTTCLPVWTITNRSVATRRLPFKRRSVAGSKLWHTQFTNHATSSPNSLSAKKYVYNIRTRVILSKTYPPVPLLFLLSWSVV